MIKSKLPEARLFILGIFFLGFGISSYGQTTLSDQQSSSYYERGLELFKQRQFAAARKAFEAHLQAGTVVANMADASYFRAFSALSLFHTDAESLFDDFLLKYPGHPRAVTGYYEVGNFYYREGSYEKAAEYYAKTRPERLRAEDRSTLHFHWGYALFNLKRFDEALGYFDKIKGQSGEYASAASYYAGYIEFKLGKLGEARQDLTKASESEGYDIIVPELLAAILYSQKEYTELISYSAPFLRGSKEAKNLHEIALYTGEAHYEMKEYSRALPFYEQYMKALKKKPAAPVLFRISFAYLQTGNSALAIENFKYVALEKDTLGQASSYYLGDLYVKDDNKNFAISAYRQAADLDFDLRVQEQAMYKLAQVYMDIGNYELAIPVLEKFTNDFPGSSNLSESRDMIAEAYVNSNNYDKALAYFEKTGLNSPRTRTAYQKAAYLKGAELFNNGKFSEAVDLFDRSLKYPSDRELELSAWFWKGEAFSTGRKLEAAAGSYMMVLQKGKGSNDEAVHKANYGLGYALFNQKKYADAAPYFKAYVDNRKPSNYRDAAVRLADCLYAQKKYDEALLYYKQSVDDGFREKDYVLYQRGVVLGFQNKSEEARRELAQVARLFPNSRYVDDAIFKSAQLDFEAGDYTRARIGFSEIINKHPSSVFVPYSLVRRASGSYNLKDYPAAASDYKEMLDNYPQHPLANSALLGLQEVLGLIGKTSEVDEYIAIYKNANPDDKAIESVEYERAHNFFFDQNYQAAVSALTAYRSSYPESANAAEALFYIGESNYRLQKPADALESYYLVLKNLQNIAPSRVYQRIGTTEFSVKNYSAALTYWQKLKAVANNKRDEYSAREGLMETHFSLQNPDSASYYAELILSDDKVSFNAQNKAGMYLAKVAFQQQRYAAALDEFLAVVNAARDVNAAEAQYYVGLIQFQQKEYKRSLETLFVLNKSFAAYELWLGKSFLLIADNYMALNELFQAKATLESVLANSPLPEIKEEAVKKLQSVKNQEKTVMVQKDTLNSPVKSDSTTQIRN